MRIEEPDLRYEIDHYVYYKAKSESLDKNENTDWKKFYQILHNTELNIIVVWARYNKETKEDYDEIDNEYSFIGTYPDWLIHINSCYYPHVGEQTDWIKIKDGHYKVIYPRYDDY